MEMNRTEIMLLMRITLIMWKLVRTHLSQCIIKKVTLLKNDSPGHFSTLKAYTGQILTLNFEPKVVWK